jgi:transcriptional regulator with XRE-family HTH domain
MMSFGTIISEARKKTKLSQKDLASRIKKENGESISAQYLNDIERERRNPPSEFLIGQFARELKLSKEYLCLAAGTIPEDFQQKLASAPPQAVEEAFKAFRRTIKKE